MAGKVVQIRPPPAEPIDCHGQPAYFSSQHNAWLEEYYSWKAGSVITLYQNNNALTSLAKKAIARAAPPYIVRKALLREPENQFRRPEYFSSRHNRWLEKRYGWKEGTVLELYQADQELVMEAIGTIADAFEAKPPEWDPADDDPLPKYRVKERVRTDVRRLSDENVDVGMRASVREFVRLVEHSLWG